MRRVYLLRHAKSSWKHPELADRDRPLAGRGKRAAKAIAKHMRAQELEPELVLCSTAGARGDARADRARARAQAGAGRRASCTARVPTICSRACAACPTMSGSVLVIGHNPGIHELALELAGSAPELTGKFPTAALATLAFHGSAWGELGPEATELGSSSPGRATC